MCVCVREKERERETEAFHGKQLWKGNIKFYFFSKCGRVILVISIATERHVGEASSCGNLLEMSDNLAVRSLCPMSEHFRVRSLGRMSGHCKAEACFRWVTVAERFSLRVKSQMDLSVSQQV